MLLLYRITPKKYVNLTEFRLKKNPYYVNISLKLKPRLKR